MVVLTDTFIDIADRHTTLYYLGAAPPPGAPLPFGSGDGYASLHRKLVDSHSVKYGEIAAQGSPAILAKLAPGYYDNNKYWARTLGSPRCHTYADSAWENLLPISATLTQRIEYLPNPAHEFKVSPVPTVVLYPCGWSTCLSLRVSGPHGLEDLAAVVTRVFKGNALRIGTGGAVTLTQVLDEVARGVRKDAFGGDLTLDFESPEILIVTSIAAKHGGSVAPGGLTPDERARLLTVVRPNGPPKGDPFKDHLYQLSPSDDLEYVVHDSCGYFLWMEGRLNPSGGNYRSLLCYHGNTFTSLLQARQWQGLVDAAVRQRPLSAPVYKLVQQGLGGLSATETYYRCAALVQFLAGSDVQASLKRAAGLKAPSP